MVPLPPSHYHSPPRTAPRSASSRALHSLFHPTLFSPLSHNNRHISANTATARLKQTPK
jgi:hypothetical protein